MSGGFNNPIIAADGALVYPAIKSPNFSAVNLTGWSIDKNGNAFFYSITVVGSVTSKGGGANPAEMLLQNAALSGTPGGLLSSEFASIGPFEDPDGDVGWTVSGSPAGTPGAFWCDVWNYVGQAGQPAFGTGWSNRGGGFVTLAFMKVPSPAKHVLIRGWVTVAAVTDLSVFTLPAGYRPANAQTIIGFGAGVAVQFNVGTGGLVSAAANLPAATNFYLEGLISLDQ